LDFRINPKVKRVGNSLTVTFDIVNNGEHEVWVKPTRFLLSDDSYRNNLANLESIKNYALIVDYEGIDTVRRLGSNQTRGHTFTVKVDPVAHKELFFYMEYSNAHNLYE